MILPPNGNSVPSKNAIDNISQAFKRHPSHKPQNTKSTATITKKGIIKGGGGNANSLLATLATIGSNQQPQQQQQQQPPTTGEALANGLQLSVAPVRRYKQYTEETLQQALREIMEGQR